jgi:signal transduction histidine kinase
VNESLLVNTLGHLAGVLIFGIFIFLLLQDPSSRRNARRPILAAALALVWNLASLVALHPAAEPGRFMELTVAIGFSVLSLLPAVLFDLCLERGSILVKAGYGLSLVAVALHVAELFREGERFHRLGLILITAGFGALTVVAALSNTKAALSRLVGTMLLFLLAMSFVHFSADHVDQAWSHELAFHHAAIPLALLILLQDYRFVLLDAFVRFLANVFFAAVFVLGSVGLWRWNPLGLPKGEAFDQAILVVSACLILVLFAWARSRLERALTKLVFGRGDEARLLAALKTPVRDEETYLRSSAALLGQHVGAEATVADAVLGEVVRPQLVGTELVVPVRTAREVRYIRLGRRSGGRRYLSDDLLTLGRAAEVLVDQLEQFREAELRRLVTQAELRALQSQIHPHFLFNALNALYGLIPREAKSARETVLNLADIFRYSLETGKMLRPLSDELRIIRAYLEVERLRLGPKLRVEIEAPAETLDVLVPVLSIQPLVENAVKHAIAPRIEGGLIRVEAKQHGGSVRISVADTGAGFSESPGNGVGLDNVAKRLDLCFGTALDVSSSSDGTVVSFAIPKSAVLVA